MDSQSERIGLPALAARWLRSWGRALSDSGSMRQAASAVANAAGESGGYRHLLHAGGKGSRSLGTPETRRLVAQPINNLADWRKTSRGVGGFPFVIETRLPRGKAGSHFRSFPETFF